MTFIPRNIEPILRKYLKLFPVVALTGARQTGKSSLLQAAFGEEYQYITFDDYRMLNLFHRDPISFMEVNNNKIIFDEVHKAPEIFNYIKIAVDNDRQNYGKYILTASAQFQVMKNISETLAGRIGLLNLLTLDYKEVPPSLRSDSIYKGSYPELVSRKFEGVEQWYSSYIETYIQRDVRTIANIGEMRDFRRLTQLLATRTSQILNMSELAKQIGISVSTVKKWISVLETSFVVFLLPPYFENFGKRIVKAPKIYFYDTGLVSFLTGISSKEIYENGPMRGALFENYIVSEILKKEKNSDSNAQLYYYRTNHGVEVDLIIDRKKLKEIIEIKNNATFRPIMIKGVEALTAITKQKGCLIYTGENLEISKKISAFNFASYLST